MIIDPKSDTPIYLQIVEQMRDAMDAGIYRAGEALPSLRVLARDIRVNPNTVQRAYEELERQGVIESRRGVGVFVVEHKSKRQRQKHERETLSLFEQGAKNALDAGTQPVRIRELFEAALKASLAKARKIR